MREDDRSFGLPPSADVNEIRRAYRELARRYRADPSDVGTEGRLSSRHRAYEVSTVGDLAEIEQDRADARYGHRYQAAFADEVDIDFPSVSSLVGRMRASFFGAMAERPVSAEVHLTPGQADAGVLAPLDLSLRHTCPVCGGRGEIWLNPCGACAGSGAGLLPHQFQLVVPPGVRHGTCLRFDVTPPYAPATRVQVRISIQ